MQAIHQNHEIESKVMGHLVEISVVLPPNFDSIKESLLFLLVFTEEVAIGVIYLTQ